MIVVMDTNATEENIQEVIDRLVNGGFSVHRSTGAVHTLLGAVGPIASIDVAAFELLPGVRECLRVSTPYTHAARSARPQGTVVRFRNGVEIGGPQVVVIAGPSMVESETQIEAAAAAAAQAGARFLRAGVFRSPATLPLLRQAADRHGLLVASEVSEPGQIDTLAPDFDLLQVGARNMQNQSLLEALGRCGRPVLLKRGVAATIEELLLAAESVLARGNADVILCERGIRTFSERTRHTMDIAAIVEVKKLSHLPIVADPSYGTGRRDKVPAMARACVAAGADGLIVEIHPDPDNAQRGGAQSLNLQQFAELMSQLKVIAPALGRSL